MHDQNNAPGHKPPHPIPNVQSQSRRHSKKLPLMILLLITTLHAQQSPGPASIPPEQAAGEIETYLKEVQQAEAVTDRALLQVSRASGESTGFSAQWMAAVAPKGSGSVSLFAGTHKTLTGWITAIRSGSDRYPPLDEIRTRMAEWRGRVSGLQGALGRVPQLEERRANVRTQRSRLKPESGEWQASRAEEERLDEEIRSALREAQFQGESSAKIPAPILPTDRTRSPFDGPVTPGPPNSLWIWTEKSSAPVGDIINAQVGLANDAGPNCKADQDYSIDLTCQGCTINNPQITIQQGDRYARTEIRVKAPTAAVNANSGKLKRSQVNVNGCASAKTIRLVATSLPDSPTRGPADGVTRLRFDLVFLDSNGQPATNYLRKYIATRLDGVGVIEIEDRHAGSLRQTGQDFLVPPDECIGHRAIFSDLPGQATVEAEYQSSKTEPMTFIFHYAFPWPDLFSMFLGVFLGGVGHFLFMRNPGKPWWHSPISSLCGSVVGIMVCYFVLEMLPRPYSFLVAGGITMIFGIAGIWATKRLIKLFFRVLERIFGGKG
jgi:hypothetical protein